MIRLKQEVDRASEMRNQALGFKGALRYVTPGTNQKSGRRKKRYLSALTEGPVDLSEPPRTGRLRDAPLRRNVTRLASSRLIPAPATELGSKMVAGRSANVRCQQIDCQVLSAYVATLCSRPARHLRKAFPGKWWSERARTATFLSPMAATGLSMPVSDGYPMPAPGRITGLDTGCGRAGAVHWSCQHGNPGGLRGNSRS